MSMEQTLSILKPDLTKRNLTGAVNDMIEKNNLKIIAQKRILMTEKQAQKFYAIHEKKLFFKELVDQMCNGPVVVQVLEGTNAISDYRTLMGATNPEEAGVNTIRKKYAISIGENSVHGSDSIENAKQEIPFFFSQSEIVN
jgi:nucleoside-diphosphate kinase